MTASRSPSRTSSGSPIKVVQQSTSAFREIAEASDALKHLPKEQALARQSSISQAPRTTNQPVRQWPSTACMPIQQCLCQPVRQWLSAACQPVRQWLPTACQPVSQPVSPFVPASQAVAVNRLDLTNRRPSNESSGRMRTQVPLPSGHKRRPSVLLDHNAAALARVRQLCCEARIFEAAAALDALELDIASTYESPKGLERSDIKDRACQLGSCLQSDPVISKLRSVHGRLKKHLDPQGLLAQSLQGSAEKWVSGELQDPSIHPEFKFSAHMRLLEGTERDDNGPTTQIITKCIMQCWPQTLSNWLALERETAIFEKEWLASCKFFIGVTGELEQLMSSSVHLAIQAFPLPCMEAANIREFAVCLESPLSGYSPGVLEIEQSLPQDKDEFEGWKVPPRRFGYVRNEGLTIKHAAPSTEDPHCVTATIVSKTGFPLPKSMLPLNLMKDIFLSVFHKTFKNMKEKVVENWESTGFPECMAKHPDLYGAVAAIKPDGLESHVSALEEISLEVGV